ncbi:aspartate racemase [Chelonobacter oris]|uniref:Aspartate racemase n=1 Tax=Chelonobacter oris TaxID=505317 RepID=A0A0A3AKA0_9PAST|nr:amino acid racemase [Chelonobacter oris]KGQ69823.1 aspartate racemase [Chelonobacter oris]
MKRLGIMGGMGPLATLDLYQKIVAMTAAQKDQDHIPVIIDSYPQIEDRTAYILGHGNTPRPKMLESAVRLRNAGAQALLIACNTAHYFADDIEKYVNLPVIHIAKVSIEAIKQRYPDAQNIAVIATDGTQKSGIYSTLLKQDGFNCVELSEQQQKKVMACIYDGAKAGNVEGYQALFNHVIEQLDADIFIAACTEIPLFLPKLEKATLFLDATSELAAQGIKFACS